MLQYESSKFYFVSRREIGLDTENQDQIPWVCCHTKNRALILYFVGISFSQKLSHNVCSQDGLNITLVRFNTQDQVTVRA